MSMALEDSIIYWDEEEPISWDEFGDVSRRGRLMEVLVKLPRELWTEQSTCGSTLLHLACGGPNDVAAAVALLQSGLDKNARNKGGGTPAHAAAANQQPRMVEVLCAAGADLRTSSNNGHDPIDFALVNLFPNDGETVRVLVANGVRLSTVHEKYRHHITPELEAFERGVLRCRAAVVAMLRVKRAGKLWMWDKFLLLELAVGVWSTRYDKGWQN